jgi:hypothetical protein
MFDDIIDDFEDLIEDVTDVKVNYSGKWHKLMRIYENLIKNVWKDKGD